MNQRAMAELSAELIIRYYENEPMPFLQHMDKEALWYGPAAGQFIRGQDAMIQTWSKEEHPLRFTMGDLETETISAHPSSCNVMLTYTVITHYPDGHDLSVNQRLLLCWGERHVTDEKGNRIKQPRILVCHISNPHGKHEDDVIYPKHFTQAYAGENIMPQKGRRIHFHGVDRAEYYYLSDTIIWVEAGHGGKHCILHTSHGEEEVLVTVAALARSYPRLFLQCHQSFLVNPHYIRSIRRFQVTLTNGTVLPIPEKKYTAFRREVETVLRNEQSG